MLETLNINEDIAVSIMNWGLLSINGTEVYFNNPVDVGENYSFKIVCKIEDFLPNENLEDAMKVISELMSKGWEFETSKYLEGTKYEWKTVLIKGNIKVQGYGKTKEVSICDAAIKTIKKQI
jgi:hypothetical protein